MTRIDLVVAVRDEEEAIPLFVDDVRRLQLPAGTTLKMLFVEDSSRDGTRDVLRRLAEQSPDVAYYSVTNDFGQGPAIVFGVARCRGDAIITMDVDGTHPVTAIPVLVERFLQGDEIVQCARSAPPDREVYRNAGAAAFHLASRLLTGVDTCSQNFYFRLMSAGTARRLLRHPRYWRLLRLPLRKMGRVSFLEVEAPDRSVGQSKYNLIRLTRLAVDGVLSLMSGARLAGWSVLIVAAAFMLWQLDMRLSAIGILLLHTALVLRYFVLERFNPLERIAVLESRDEATAPAITAGRVAR